MHFLTLLVPPEMAVGILRASAASLSPPPAVNSCGPRSAIRWRGGGVGAFYLPRKSLRDMNSFHFWNSDCLVACGGRGWAETPAGSNALFMLNEIGLSYGHRVPGSPLGYSLF